MQFNNITLVIEKKYYAIETANAYIAYDLDNWPKILLNNFELKNCLFSVNNIVKILMKIFTYIVAIE